MTDLQNTASVIRWAATDVGVQAKLFVYDPAGKFLCATGVSLYRSQLEQMVVEMNKRLEEEDTALPPWSD